MPLPKYIYDMENGRFKLERSKKKEGWWVLTDTENLVVLKFKEHAFNDEQEVTFLDESSLLRRSDCATAIAAIMREMADYMSDNWLDIAMPEKRK